MPHFSLCADSRFVWRLPVHSASDSPGILWVGQLDFENQVSAVVLIMTFDIVGKEGQLTGRRRDKGSAGLGCFCVNLLNMIFYGQQYLYLPGVSFITPVV